MKKTICCLLIILMAWPVLLFAGDCKEGFDPDIKALKKLEPLYQQGDMIQVANPKTGTPIDAQIVKVIPYWDSTDCAWKVNYEAEVVNLFRFSEADPNVKLAQPGGRK